jgi:hypothetical protein
MNDRSEIDNPLTQLMRARLVPAIWCNRFNVTVYGDVTRISFGEAVHSVDEEFRAAVMVRTEDALALADLIRSTFDRHTAGQAPQHVK